MSCLWISPLIHKRSKRQPGVSPNAGFFFTVEVNMAKTVQKKVTKKAIASPFSIYWSKENYLILAAGAVLTIIGFILLGSGNWDSSQSLYLAPILLVAAYVLVFPASIFFRRKNNHDGAQE